MKATDAKTQFREEVFPAELAEIRRRRAALHLPAEHLEGPPAAELGLAGLALSGGGIRSATFCLGAIQALAKHGALKRMDYLSTVSGGGFIGSCLSSALNDPETRPVQENFPLRHEPGQVEPEAVRHVRNSQHYLAPNGVLDKIRIPAILVRGMIINLLVFVPYLMLAAQATDLLFEISQRLRWPNEVFFLAPPVFFLALILSFPLVAHRFHFKIGWERRNRYDWMLSWTLLASLISLAMAPLHALTRRAIYLSWEDLAAVWRGESLGSVGPVFAWACAALVTIVLLLMFASKASQRASRWSGRAFLYSLGLLGPGLLLAMYLLMCMMLVDSPHIDSSRPILRVTADPELTAELDRAGQARARLPASVAGEFGVRSNATVVTVAKGNEWKILQPGNSPEPFYRLKANAARTWLGLYPDFIACLESNVISASMRRAFQDRGGLPEDARIAPAADAWPDAVKTWQVTAGGRPRCAIWLSSLDGRVATDQDIFWGQSHDWIFLGIMAGLFLFHWRFVNVNMTSIHDFYRDRLSQAYLIRLKNGGLEPNDAQKLTKLNRTGAAAPYHLINAALNIDSCSDRNVRGRSCDFFVFAKHHTGSERTGYCPTAELERLDRRLDLATAAAISGAAAAPNAGTVTVKPLTFSLTCLNIRLGYWIPNPAAVRNSGAWRRFLLKAGPGHTYLLREALGRINARLPFLNLSDGGHIENLGIYQLLRRRCKLILAVDSEADPQMTFDGLLRLILYAGIDLGIEIQIDLEPLRKNDAGLSRQHSATGKIIYGDGAVGRLIYLKSSLTGDESEFIRGYKARRPDFPHQSTAEQFFDESRFEAYRALGFHIAEDFFRAEQGGAALFSGESVRAETASRREGEKAIRLAPAGGEAARP